MPGALDLHRHFFAGQEFCPVDLADGRGSDGRLFEIGIDAFQGDAQFFFYDFPDLGKREGRHVVLQLGELLDQIQRDQIGAGRKDLSHLDKGWPQLFKDHPEALVVTDHLDGFCGPLRDEAHADFYVAPEVEAVDDAVVAVLEQNRENLTIPAEILVCLGEQSELAKLHVFFIPL